MQKKEPLVSIGLAVRNGQDYLCESLDSLLGQTYKNFELIISDNVSDDDTHKICEEYVRKDYRIRYIRQKENIGGYRNYDFLKNEAKGEYFMWTTHDDKWDKNFIEKCLAKLKEDSGAIVAFANWDAFFNSGERIHHPPEQYFSFEKDIYTRLKSYILLRSSQGKIEMIYGLWKKNALKNMYSATEFYSDDNFMFKMSFEGPFIFINEILFFKRASSGFQNTQKITIKSIALFFLNRIRALHSKLFYANFKCVFRSLSLTPKEKTKLFGWLFYAYLRSIWCGYA